MTLNNWFSQFSKSSMLFIGGLIAVIIISALALRLFPLFHQVEFYYDQARDAFALQRALDGQWPTLGPAASVSDFALPPQYYYAMLPFATISPWPQLHILVNTIACLLGIGLIYLICYHWLLQRLASRQRLVLSLLTTLSVALSFWYFGLSIGVWNPNPLPLITLGLTACLYAVYKNVPLKVFSHQLSPLYWWIIAGLCLGFSMGLHSTALFVLPLWATMYCAYWLYKTRQWQGPLLLALTTTILHIPYLYGQTISNWQNTKAIIHYLTQSSGASWLDRLNRAIDYTYTLIQTSILPNITQPAIISLFAVLLLLAGGYAFFKLNKTLFLLSIIPWLLFILFGSGYQDIIHHHYILLGYWLPLLLLVSLIGYSYIIKPGSPLKHTAVLTTLFIILLSSIGLNTYHTAKAVKTDLTADHRISVVEKRHIIDQLPRNITICSYYGQDYTDLDYLNVYVSQRQDIRFTQDCQPGHVTLYIQDLNKRQADKPFNPALPVIQQTSSYILQSIR